MGRAEARRAAAAGRAGAGLSPSLPLLDGAVRGLRRGVEDAAIGLAQRLEARADIAVTGLRRSGKTVFLTAAIHNLKRAALSPQALPGLAVANEGRLVAVEEAPANLSTVARFPTRENLAALLGDRPDWPVPTDAVRRTELEIRYRSRSLLARAQGTLLAGGAERILTLGLFDYPGEWLLDLGLLDADFRQWSQATFDLLEREPRRAAAEPFLAFLRGLDPTGRFDPEQAERGHRLYRALLAELRDRLGMTYLQPGRFVMPDRLAEAPVRHFFPLPPGAGTGRRGTLAGMLEERYRAYCDATVLPFFRESFARTNRQVVLVDLLAALVEGRHVYEDLRRAVEAIAAAIGVNRRGWLSALLPRRFERTLFAATKADHVPELHRDRLEQHLAGVFGDLANRARMEGSGWQALAVAAVRATIDETVVRDVGEVHVVTGRTAEGIRQFQPGLIPKADPPAEFWTRRTLQVPRFLPPPRSADGAIPSINMDAALDYLVGDLLR